MTLIRKCEACGNSPKNLLLQDLTIALARADFLCIRAIVSEDVLWTVPGRKPVSGVDAFCKAVTRHGLATQLELRHVVSHGKAGAVEGVVQFGKKQRAFCHVFEFSSAKGDRVKSITTYSLPLD